ncbi:MAG TPA: glycosyltransferase family A protein [Pyrinomonadaceae bacterium]
MKDEPNDSAAVTRVAEGAADTAGASPAVSVVVPAYNVAPYIAGVLESVFAQTFTDYEVIIVNDGSPDTEELERALAPYRERLVYLKQENAGPSAARNAGIRRARGSYVALLDGDDEWLPTYLEEQLAALADGLDLVYTDALLFGEGELVGRTFMQTCPSRGPVTVESLLAQRCAVITSCVVARRESLVAAGLFNEDYRRSEDFDLWVRMAHGGARLGYRRKVLARHRMRGDSLAADQTRMHEAARGVYAELARTLELTPRERAAIEVEMANYEFDLALARAKRALAAGEYALAGEELARARGLGRASVLRSLKLRLALLCLSAAPRLTRRFYLRRSADARPRATLQDGDATCPSHAGEANKDAHGTL